MKHWIEVAWDCVGAIPFVKDNAATRARFVEGCLQVEAVGRRVRRNRVQSALTSLLVVSMVTAAQPSKAMTVEDMKAWLIATEADLHRQWAEIAKENADTLRHFQTAAEYYKSAQMAYRMYERIQGGNINLLVSNLMPSITFETDRPEGDMSPDAVGGYGAQTDMVYIRPIPTDARRNELARKFNVRVGTNFNLGDYFKGNPLEWFDVDSTTSYVTENGMSVTKRPEMIQQMAKTDATLAYVMSMARMGMGNLTLQFSTKSLEGSISDNERLDLKRAYDNLSYLAEAEGSDSQAYVEARQKYTNLMLEINSKRMKPRNLSPTEIAARLSLDAKELEASYAQEAEEIQSAASRNVAHKENDRLINQMYKVKDPKPKWTLAEFLDPTKPTPPSDQAQSAMAYKAQATAGASYMELSQINKLAALRALEVKKEKLEEKIKQQQRFAGMAKVEATKVLAKEQEDEVLSLIRRKAMEGTLGRYFVVPNPSAVNDPNQDYYQPYTGGTYDGYAQWNTELMDQAYYAIKGGDLKIVNGDLVGEAIYFDPTKLDANATKVTQTQAQIRAKAARDRKATYDKVLASLTDSMGKIPNGLVGALMAGWASFWANFAKAGGRVFPSLPTNG